MSCSISVFQNILQLINYSHAWEFCQPKPMSEYGQKVLLYMSLSMSNGGIYYIPIQINFYDDPIALKDLPDRPENRPLIPLAKNGVSSLHFLGGVSISKSS